MKLTPKATSREEKLNILSYNPGFKTKFHISFLKTILDFAKLSTLPEFLPQPFNFLHGYIRHIRDISQLCVCMVSYARIMMCTITEYLCIIPPV